MLGKLMHLISDRIWYSEFITKYAKIINSEDKILFDLKHKKQITEEEFKENIYNDYSNINEYLIVKYKLDLKTMLNDKQNKNIYDYVINSTVLKDKKETLEDLGKTNYLTKKDVIKWLIKSEKEMIRTVKKIKKTHKKGNKKK